MSDETEELRPDSESGFPSIFGVGQPVYVGAGTDGAFDFSSTGGMYAGPGFGGLFSGVSAAGTGSLFSGSASSGPLGSGGLFGSTETSQSGANLGGATASNTGMSGASVGSGGTAMPNAGATGATTMTPEQILMTMMNTMSVQAQIQSTAMQKLVERLEQLEQQQRAQSGSSSQGQGQQGSFRSSPNTDEKPYNISIPAANASGWRTRYQELTGYKAWYQQFLSWLNLLNPAFPPEIRDVLKSNVVLTRKDFRNESQWNRGQKLYSFIRQAFSGYHKVENIAVHYSSECAEGEVHGFELMRRIHLELSLQTRAEAMTLRREVLEMSVKEDTLSDLVRTVDARFRQYESLIQEGSAGLQTSLGVVDVENHLKIPEADKVMLVLKLLPYDLQKYLQLHRGSSTKSYRNLMEHILEYDRNTRLLGDTRSKLNTVVWEEGVHFSKDGKGKGGKKGNHNKGNEKGKQHGGHAKGKSKGKSREGSPHPGKGKIKGKDKGKSKSQERKRPSSADAKKQGLCFECGKPGHMKKDCPLLKNKTQQHQHEHVEQLEDVEIFGTLRHVLSSSDANESHHASEMSAKAQSGVRDDATRWLVDSGATCHIIGEEHIDHYHVAKSYPHDRVELRAANEQQIRVSGLVDLVVQFPVGQGKFQRVTLQKVLVAQVRSCVLSPVVLSMNGWLTVLGGSNFRSELRLKRDGREDLRCPIVMNDRAWWLISKPSAKGGGVKPTRSALKQSPKAKDQGPQPMDVGSVAEALKKRFADEGILEKFEKEMRDILGCKSEKPTKSREPSKSTSSVSLAMHDDSRNMGQRFYVRVLDGELGQDHATSLDEPEDELRQLLEASAVDDRESLMGAVRRLSYGAAARLFRAWKLDDHGIGPEALSESLGEQAISVSDRGHRLISEPLGGHEVISETVGEHEMLSEPSTCLDGLSEPLGGHEVPHEALGHAVSRIPFRSEAVEDDRETLNEPDVAALKEWKESLKSCRFDVEDGDKRSDWKDDAAVSAAVSNGASISEARRDGASFGTKTLASTEEASDVWYEVSELTPSCDAWDDSDNLFHDCPECFYIGDDDDELSPDSDDGVLYSLEWVEGFTYVKSLKTEHLNAFGEEAVSTLAEEDAVEEDLPLEENGVKLFSHVSCGHVPYLSSCDSCCRARGKIPARRISRGPEPSMFGADYTYFGPLKVLTLVAFMTQMCMVVIMTENADSNARAINRAWSELGLSGRAVSCKLDGEQELAATLRRAARLENSSVTALNLELTPPDRHQANGKVERWHGLIKHTAASNVLYVESRIGQKIALESPLAGHVLTYTARKMNLHRKPKGSAFTPYERMRGRATESHQTFPFGCLLVGKPVESSEEHSLEQLSQLVYLGPAQTSGGGTLGYLAKDSRIGVESSRLNKVHKFQAVRLVKPVEWPVEPFLVGEKRPVDDPDNQHLGERPEDLHPGPEFSDTGPGAVKVPAGGAPKSWFQDHAFTPGCSACEALKKKGSAKGRVHSSACKKRYKTWLEDELKKRLSEGEREKKRVADREAEPASPGPFLGGDKRGAPQESPLLPAPGGESSGSSGKRHRPGRSDVERGDDPMGSDAGQGGVPMPPSGADVEMEPGTPRSAEPNPDAMDVDDSLVNALIEQEQTRVRHEFLQFEQSTRGGPWAEFFLFGRKVKQQLPREPKCETTGVAITHDELCEGLKTELDQLTNLKVGRHVGEQEASTFAKAHGIKPIATRWVIVKKPDGRTRARVVVKDFRSSGGTSMQEGFYAPTSSLESLRVFLMLVELYGLVISGLDVSTAFMYAELSPKEWVLVSMPSSMKHVGGEARVLLSLFKAMNGLRLAPLRWFQSLRKALFELGFEATADPTIFMRKEPRYMLVIIYVDDMLFAALTPEENQAFFEVLIKKFKCKSTGYIGRISGKLDFLGRVIMRDKDGLSIGLPEGYWKSIEDLMPGKGGITATLTAPDVVSLEKRARDDAELQRALNASEASVYRAALGKLSWFSLTCPILAFYVGWLGAFQAAPVELGMRGLKSILKFAKSFSGMRMYVLTQVPDHGDHEILVTCDASWTVKSIMGGMIHYRGCYLKSWSRKVPVPALSSAEAELFSLVEGLKEGIALALVVETAMFGLPKRLPSGVYERETGRLKVRLRSDSEAAINIARMTGLLRRVRHLELRIEFLQFNVDNDRVELEFLPGQFNGADVLTKPPDRDHIPLFMRDSGSWLSEAGRMTRTWMDMFMDYMEPLSGQNRSKVKTALLGALRYLVEGHGNLMKAVGKDADAAAGADPRAECDERHVRFSEVDHVMAIPPRHVPRRLETWLRKHPRMEAFRAPLAMLFAGVTKVVIEVCCQEGSSLYQVGMERGYAVFAITEKMDVCNPETAWVVQQVLKRVKVALVWVSTPCTSGCRLRYLHLKRPAFLARWKEQVKLHRRMWSAIHRMLGMCRATTVIAQEWPETSDLWQEPHYERIAHKLQLFYEQRLQACCLDGYHKVWRIKCTHAAFAERLKQKPCTCETVKRHASLKMSGFYSREVAGWILTAFGRMTSDERAERASARNDA